MSSSTSNIKTDAGDISAKQLSHHGGRDAEHAGDVDRFWHCVAAELEAGLIDAAENPMPERGFDKGLEAYRDWCLRHPESQPTIDPA